jgi:Raf kinase inhibitor-like YbhB/YbcL family protein
MSGTGSAYAYFVYGSDSTGESLMSSSISVFDTEIFPRGFSINITNLVPGTRYWYIAGASADSHDFGNEVEYFNTLSEEEPTGEQEEEEEEEPTGEQEEEEEYYTLTISSSNNGSVVNPTEGSHTYDEDVVVNLEAVADEGYQFDRWEGEVDDSESAFTTITMNADKSVTAYFESIPPFELISSAFNDGEQMPSTYSRDGDNTSPPLEWTGVPYGTVSFVLIMYDDGGWGELCVHWIVFNMPADVTSLDEGASSSLPEGALHGTVAGGRRTYYGCYPPEGLKSTYYFTIYALDTMLNLNEGATRQQVLAAMEGHILGEAQLSGTCSR